MSLDQILVGKVGISTSSYSQPLITLDPSTGTITAQQICGNINISANVNWNEYDVDSTFRTLTLSDVSINNSSIADRLIVQLPNSQDGIYIRHDGQIMRYNTNTLQANWILGAPTPNNGGSQCRFNTNAPNLQLYAPDNGGAVALYNTANAGYAWYLGTGGDAEFNNVTVRGWIQSEAVPVFVNANYTVPNDGNNYEILINANTPAIGSGDLIITLPTDPTHQMTVNMSVIDLGVANSIAVGDGTPQIAFIANGLRSFVDLKSKGLSKTTFKHTTWGVNGDWWMVSPF